MKTHLICASLSTLVLISLIATPLSAAVAFRIDPSVTDIVSGGQVTLAIVLVDTDGEIAADGGLFGGGTRLLVQDSSSATATITDFSQITPNSGFSLATTSYPFDASFPNSPPAGFSQIGGFIGSSQFFTPVSPISGEILLGNFVVTVSGSPGTSATVQPATLGGTLIGNLGFNTGVNFDALIGSAVGTTITIVPEPCSSGLCCLMFGTYISVRQRRSLGHLCTPR